MNQNNKKKMKHNYTSELELKSLLIRTKNRRLEIGTPEDNAKINKYIKWHTTINAKKYAVPAKRNLLKVKLKTKIIELSETTSVDKKSYERLGEVVLLMIMKILTKPQFSGYTYKDDFYSDAVYKILKYLNNFNHKLISKITGLPVNAFAYISQIIHNSILYIINTKKRDAERKQEYIRSERTLHNVTSPTDYIDGYYVDNPARTGSNLKITRMIDIEETIDLMNTVEMIVQENPDADALEIYFPANYEVSFDEYDAIKKLDKKKILVKRASHD